MKPRALILVGDCRKRLRKLADNSVDSVCTDPPYGLSGHPDMEDVMSHWLRGDDFKGTGPGFLGAEWDSFVPGPGTWREVYRVLKPGGFALVFSGTRTIDLMGLSLRLAGFRVRDAIGCALPPLLAWHYNQGFPHGKDVSKEIDRQLGAKRKKIGGGKPWGHHGWGFTGTTAVDDQAITDEAKQWQGWNTLLKPSWEPVLVVQKPFKGPISKNILKHGTGGMNIHACQLGTSGGRRTTQANPEEEVGRWPPNSIFVHSPACTQKDCHPACPAPQLDRGKANLFRCTAENEFPFNSVPKPSKGEKDANLAGRIPKTVITRGGEITADAANARYNIHVTVKPIDVMLWMIKLVTQPTGRVLDPFLGSGTTGVAAIRGGFRFVGCELNDDYAKIAAARIQGDSSLFPGIVTIDYGKGRVVQSK